LNCWQIAIAAKHHGVDFYVAAPVTSIDTKLKHGSDITIEQRPGHELTHVFGQQVGHPLLADVHVVDFRLCWVTFSMSRVAGCPWHWNLEPCF
jgi:methylthioribose-1-phosphate isomerase